jgi:hypothetical protein
MILTPDNPHLSRPKYELPDDPDSPLGEGQPAPIEDQASAVDDLLRAVDCTARTPDPVPAEVAALVNASIAENTRRAYRSDLAHFVAWGAQMPAEPALVASYLAAHAETLSVATLVHRVATISKAHEAKRLANPCRSEIVRAPRFGASNARGGSPSARPSHCSERTCSESWTPWARV